MAIVAALVVAGCLIQAASNHEYSAVFERSTGLYRGNEIRVLGVKVGSVTKVTPLGTDVRVDFTVDADQKVPADVKAVIVAPSLVTGRFVQLAPVYGGGPELKNDSVIPLEHTAVPVEFDTVKTQLTDLSEALGPNGSDIRGPLSRLITTTANNLDASTAKDLRASITGMSKAVAAVSDSKGDIFLTVRAIQEFLQNLVDNERALRGFSKELGTASAWLSDDRKVMAGSVSSLEETLGDLTKFVRTNRKSISDSVDKLATVSETLAEEKVQLADILHRGPTVIDNYYNIQDPYHGGVIGRPTLNYFSNVAQFTCGLILGVGGTADNCSQAVQTMLQALKLPLFVPGTPGHPVATPTGANPLAPKSSGDVGLNDKATHLTSQIQSILADLLLGGLK